MLTTRPRASRNSGRKAWITATWPITLTSNCWRRASMGNSSNGPGTAIPALFTSPAIPASPTAAPTMATAAAMEAPSVTSISTGVSREDALARNLSAAGSARTPAKTRNPRRSNSKAHASPMPLEAPVMTIAGGELLLWAILVS